jgi:hypothetical protein
MGFGNVSPERLIGKSQSPRPYVGDDEGLAAEILTQETGTAMVVVVFVVTFL